MKIDWDLSAGGSMCEMIRHALLPQKTPPIPIWNLLCVVSHWQWGHHLKEVDKLRRKVGDESPTVPQFVMYGGCEAEAELVLGKCAACVQR